MTLDAIIRAVQLDRGLVDDGKPGPATWGAIYEALITSKAPKQTPVIVTGGTVDPRSEANIATLHPRVQPYARSLVKKAAAAGITIKIISGMRTYEEQDVLYTYGRTVMNPEGKKPGKPLGNTVTNARGGYSNHNFGLAFDIGIFKGNTWLPESPLYAAVAPLGLDLALDWGGNWKTPVDQPHYQLRPAWAKDMPESAMLTELRRRKASSRDFFA